MTKTIQEALRWASSLLGTAGADADGARYVLEIRLDWSPSQLQLHARDALTEAQWTQFEADVARLVKFEPAQYVVGVAPFFGDLFNVTPAVLIPRFDTEELVAWAAAEQGQATTGLDLGTGSGAIGLTLAKQLPSVAMTLSDVSPAALAVAQINANRLRRAVRLVESDMFAALPERFDFIVSNLPYISHAEEAVMDESTKRYEPALALYADHAGLALFERFVAALPAHLNAGGAAYLEFGYHQRAALAALVAAQLPGWQAEFRRDLAGQDRMLKLTKE
ncbi:peptide chain release factor N(5)-glutamine methyltransferase [Lacticaseibacillus nasuensis]|uniref:peptide chain release factor N(5)-glutamine methyltransferase n=1 Tax=Lacticaseibacillus nasuensis TaxID=944671 RepID=UPI002247B63F|nr:peptide chain release factor N(5)-glutamine methyltransferase [Lacticaseibacillus nasuensis]MCX2455519.1 peptide chain release factor N(5)-glutamine methyltransferase [Lacticaseibacillus nasuensis]